MARQNGGENGSDTEEPARVRDAGRGMSIFTGRDAGQRRQLPPAEGRAGRGEFLGHRPVVFLGVEGPVLADRVPEQQIEDRAGRTAEGAIAGHQGRCTCLVIAPDGRLGFGEQGFGIERVDLLEVSVKGIRLRR